jgi:hypothetical protein
MTMLGVGSKHERDRTMDAQKQFESRSNEAKQILLYIADRLDEMTQVDIRGNFGYAGSMGHVLSLLKESVVTVDQLHESSACLTK